MGVESEKDDNDDDNDASSKATEVKDGKEKVPPMFVFFDFETMQDKICSKTTELGEIFTHEPNLCVAHIVCDMCKNKEKLGECARCGENHQIFRGPSCLDDFCNFLFGLGYKNVIAIAHNAKGFDSQFLMQYLFRQGIKPEIINRGTEIMALRVGLHLKVLDSYNFMPMPLAQLPKAFGVEELAKG